MTTRIVLVPGFWLGEWAWDEVAGDLRSRGADVVALTLPTKAADGGPVSLADRAAAIEDALEAGEAERRILVVHSGSAFPGTLAIDRRPDLADRLILVDTAPPKDGLAFMPDATSDYTAETAWDSLKEEGSLEGLTDEQLAEFRHRAVPEPHSILVEEISLSDADRHSVPLTAICTVFPAEAYQSFAEQGVPFLAALADFTDVTYIDLPTSHWPMWSEPAKLADIIWEQSQR